MKISVLCRFCFLIVVGVGAFLSSCDKVVESSGTTNDYYVSNDYKYDIAGQEVKNGMAISQLLYPNVASDIASFIPSVNDDASVYKVTYKTTLQGKSVVASGLVCLPKKAGNYPIVSFQNGTITENSKCPTSNPNNQAYWILETVATMGFIVVMPDYIGFGASSSMTHPYLHAESTTQSILHLIRATKEFVATEKLSAIPTKDLYIAGYSQGGWATMQAQKAIEKNYSSEFNLIASSCASGPYSIEDMNNFMMAKTDFPQPYFLTYVLNAYVSYGLVPNTISDFVNAPYASKIAGLYDGTHSADAINQELSTKIADLFTSDYRTSYASATKFASARSAFAANSVTPWMISTPTRLYHGTGDTYIPYSQSQTILAGFKAAGVPDSKIQLIAVNGDHPTAVVPVGFATIKWFVELKK